MSNKKTLLEIKNKILADAISAADIIEVDVKEPDDNNIHLYIKTNDLNTVDVDKFADICLKYSTDKLFVTFQIPSEKMVGDVTVKNTDKICVFIEAFTEPDPSAFVAFE